MLKNNTFLEDMEYQLSALDNETGTFKNKETSDEIQVVRSKNGNKQYIFDADNSDAVDAILQDDPSNIEALAELFATAYADGDNDDIAKLLEFANAEDEFVFNTRHNGKIVLPVRDIYSYIRYLHYMEAHPKKTESVVYGLKSKSLFSLNAYLNKLSLQEDIEIIKQPVLEADDTFSSLVKSPSALEGKLPSNIEVNKQYDLSAEQAALKQDLTQDVLAKIKDSLKLGIEVQNILNEIDKLNNANDKSEWIVNEDQNTAILRSKDARIFKQNNYICLSHEGEVELFKTVPELHAWLKEHNYPLPKHIKIHEASVEELSQKFKDRRDAPKMSELGLKKNDKYDDFIKTAQNKVDEIDKNLLSIKNTKVKDLFTQKNEILNQRNELKKQLFSKGTSPEQKGEIKKNISNLNLTLDEIEASLQNTYYDLSQKELDKHHFNRYLITGDELRRKQAPYTHKMSLPQYKYRMNLINKDDLPQQPRNTINSVLSIDAYNDKKDALQAEYSLLSTDTWNKIEHNLENSKTIKDDFLDNYDKKDWKEFKDKVSELIHSKPHKFWPFGESTFTNAILNKINEIEECGAACATTTASFSPAVTYTANKRENCTTDDEEFKIEEELLSEKKDDPFYDESKKGYNGYPGTPFENKIYKTPYERGAEFLAWFQDVEPSADENNNIIYDKYNPERKVKNLDKNRYLNDISTMDGDTLEKLYQYAINDTYNDAINMKAFHILDGQDKAFKSDGFVGLKKFYDKEGNIVNKEELVTAVEILNKKTNAGFNPNFPIYKIKSAKDQTNLQALKNLGQYFKDQNWYPKTTGYAKARMDYLRNNQYKDPVERSARPLADQPKEKNTMSAISKDIFTLDASETLKQLDKAYDNNTLDENKFLKDLMQQIKATKEKDEMRLYLDDLVDLLKNGDVDSELEGGQLSDKGIDTIEAWSKFLESSDINENLELKEDDSPEDFATNLDVDLNNLNSDTSSDKDDSIESLDIPDIDSSEMEQPDFGNISNTLNLGDYGPDDDDTEEEIENNIPEENYRIVDVLANDSDPSDINVKLQNIETGKIQIRKLYELDI